MALCGILLSLIILSIQDTDEGINNYLTNTSGYIYYHTNTTLVNNKPYTLLLDTYLTEDVAIPSTNCNCDTTNGILCTILSSTCSPLAQAQTYPVGIADLIGDKYTSTVKLFEKSIEAGVVLITAMHNTIFNPLQFGYDGFLGASLTTFNLNKGWLYNLKSSSQISHALLGIQTNKKSGIIYSEIDIGEAKMKPKFTVKITANDWKFKVASIQLGNDLLTENANVIINTGSPYIIVPKSLNILSTIRQQAAKHCKIGDIDGGTSFYFNCSSRYDYIFFPQFQFIMDGGEVFTLYPNQYTYFPFTEETINQGYLQIIEWESDEFDLGLPFTQEFYTVLDFDNKQIMLTPLKVSKTYMISGVLAGAVAGIFLIVFIIALLNKRFC